MPKKRGRKPADDDTCVDLSAIFDKEPNGSLMKTPPILLWKSSHFKQLMLPDSNGNSVYWVDLFYRDLNQDLGLIPRDLFDRCIEKFPPFLLHSMLACCYKSTVLPLSVFQSHFQTAGKLMNSSTPDIFICMAEALMSLFCYHAGYYSYGIPYFTRAIATSNIIGLTQRFSVPPVEFEPSDFRILEVRTWVLLYSVDYYYREVFEVPSMMSDAIPQSILGHMTVYSHTSPLFHEDNLLSFSIYLLPLFNIGRRFYHALDGSLPLVQMEQELDLLLGELNRWHATLPPLRSFPESGNVPFSTELFWDTYLLINWHGLYLTIISHRFCRLIEFAPMADPCIYHSQLHADRLTSLFIGCSYHYQAFERMASIMAKFMFQSAVIQSCLAYRDSQFLENPKWALRMLQSPLMKKYQPQSTSKLVRFVEQPFLAIEYLKRLNKVL
jgi:hypothetical protein